MKSPAVTRTVALLRELARSEGTPVSVSELARRLDIPKSSVSNFCETLEASDFVERRETGYVIGWGAAEIGFSYVTNFDPVSEFYRFWNNASNIEFEHTVQLAVLLDGIDMMFVARRAGSNNIQLVGSIGKRLPASCTAAGKALLASLPARDLEQRLQGMDHLPAMTANSQVSIDAFKNELETICVTNRSVNDEETIVGVYCVGAALTKPELMETGSSPIAISMTAVKVQMMSEPHGGELAMMQKFDTLVRAITPRLGAISNV